VDIDLCYPKMQLKHTQRLAQHRVVVTEPFSEPMNASATFSKGGVGLGQIPS